MQDWAGTISVNATNPKLVAIGWMDSYFISNDGAATWFRFSTTGDNTAPGIHGIEIVAEGSLLLATDRGFYSTADNGATNSSVANQNFPNLQFEDGALDAINAGFAVSTWTGAPSLSCNLHDGEQLWKQIDDSSGTSSIHHSVTFVRNGQLFDGSSEISARMMDPFGRPPGWTAEQTDVPMDPPIPGPGFAVGTIWEAVDVPVSMSQTSDGSVLVVIGFLEMEVYGVFNGRDSNAHGSTLTISKLFDLTEAVLPDSVNVSAIAWPDGQSIFVGTDDGAFFRAVPKTPGKPRISGVAWTAGTWVLTNIVPSGGLILTQISARVNDTLFAIAPSEGLVLRLDGNTLTPLPSPAASSILSIPSENGMLVITTPDPDPGTVFQSLDKGQTWTDISHGLPASPHPVAIRHAREPGGASLLYLFTSGWSLWTKFIHPLLLNSAREVTISGRMGIEINSNNSGLPFPPQSAALTKARSVAEFKVTQENEQVKVYLTVRLEYNGVDDSVKVTYGVFLNNFGSGNQGRADGVVYVVAPGSSKYINIFVEGTQDNSDNSNCDFLITN